MNQPGSTVSVSNGYTKTTIPVPLWVGKALLKFFIWWYK